MQLLVLFFSGFYNPSSTLITKAQVYSIVAQIDRVDAAFTIVYAMEFLCLSAAKLPVPHAATRATQTRCRWQAAAVANRGHHRFLFS
jgi:hypothetical protein